MLYNIKIEQVDFNNFDSYLVGIDTFPLILNS